MVLVKICGVTNLEDALAAAEAGADMLGFNFYPKSPRYITPGEARRIVESLPPGVKGYGVFVNEDGPEVVKSIAREAGLSAVQLHGDESPEFCDALGGLFTIKALRVGPDYKPESAKLYRTDAVLLDAYSGKAYGGTGETFDWSLARETRDAVGKLFLAGGLTASTVAAAVEAVRPYAVDVCSGVESSPGRKDHALVRRFVEAARAAGQRD
jgi:phosphoribosylanthranilate isomerase